MKDIFYNLKYRLKQIKRFFCGRFNCWKDYRKLVKRLKDMPEYKIKTVKVTGIYKQVHLELEILDE